MLFLQTGRDFIRIPEKNTPRNKQKRLQTGSRNPRAYFRYENEVDLAGISPARSTQLDHGMKLAMFGPRVCTRSPQALEIQSSCGSYTVIA